MKFSILSGAYKNAGDFLIVERSASLLRYVYPDCVIKKYERRINLSEYISEINSSDALIIAGGPAYDIDAYPNILPLMESLDDIKCPIYTIGVGWYGSSSSAKIIYDDYIFTKETMPFLRRLAHDGTLSCRDRYSAKVLRNNSIYNVKMTGCPAWYSIRDVQDVEISKKVNIPFKVIGVSDFGNTRNLRQSLKLVHYLIDKFPSAHIIYVFHRGIKADNNTSQKEAKIYEDFSKILISLGVEVKDISYSAEGFQIYDECDLHIGMRVHAHIYNLSIRHPSILIEEDGRGAGVNEALGLERIKTYYDSSLFDYLNPSSKTIYSKVRRKIGDLLFSKFLANQYLIKEIDDYIDALTSSDFYRIRKAFEIQKDYFAGMIKHIESFSHSKLQ